MCKCIDCFVLQHHLPASMHTAEVALTFFEQLLLPFLMLLPMRAVRLTSGLLEIFFQLAIVGTGNYAWINFVGILPCLSLLDDQFLSSFFTAEAVAEADDAAAQEDEKLPAASVGTKVLGWFHWMLHGGLCIGLVLLITVKSVDPLVELFSKAPWLHYYDDYFLVNSQGVFGFINQERTVLVLSYTHGNITMPHSDCADSKKTPFQAEGGKTLSCAQLAGHCNHPQHGAAIQQHCPLSCRR